MIRSPLRRYAATAALLALSVVAEAAKLPGPLVDAAWLHQHLDEVAVLDVRSDVDEFTGTPEYEVDDTTGAKTLVAVAGHVPGARLIDFDRIRVDREIGGRTVRKLLPDATRFEAVLQQAGVPAGRPLVITYNGQSADELDMAARLYWSLKVYGANDLAILDGGDAGWLAAGYPLVADAPSSVKGDWTAGAFRPELLADAADVEKAAARRVQLVDARPLPQFLGLSHKKPLVTAGGHVAGARSFPVDVHARSRNGAQVFLSAAEYRGVMRQQGIDVQAPAIAYCNTGHLASGAWFVMSELLGNASVRLYDGSMHDWTTAGKPVVGIGINGG